MILIAAFSRLLTNAFHLWNFTPIVAMALFSGATIRDKKLAFLVPLVAMVITDAFLGFYDGIFVVYFTLLAITMFGFLLQNRIKPLTVIGGSLGSSVIFYLITNFALIYPTWLYPHTMDGIIKSYTMAIPFFRNAIVGDLIYSAILFGSYELIKRTILAPEKAA